MNKKVGSPNAVSLGFGPWMLNSYDDVVVTQEIIPLGNYGPSNSTIPADVKCKAMEQTKGLLKKYCNSKDICVTKEAGKEPDMNTYDDVQNARRYLIREIDRLSEQTHIDLQHKFNLVDDYPPSWGKELVQRILDGKYSIPETIENWSYPYGIRWHDPSKKEDKEGFKTAWDSFTTAEQRATDTANVLTAAEGLAALDDLREYADELVHGKKSKK